MQSKRQLHAHSAFARLRTYFASHTPKYLAGLIAIGLCIVVMVMPSAYTVEGPGPTQDVLGEVSGKKVITVSGATVHNDSGKLLLTTVNASGVPGYPVTNAVAMWAWLDPKQTVMPREAVVPVGQTSEEYAQKAEKQMTSSENAAAQAALAFMADQGMDVSNVKVSMHVEDIGGPSAGMMYTLGVIDKLTEANETGGKVIAGTGTMNAQGEVGAIGGIRLKMLGAKRDGATWFIAPEANCNEVVGHVPEGLTVVKAATLEEAYQALVAIGEGNGSSLAGCSAE